MANFFKNKVVKDVGTTLTPVLETQTNSRITVIGLSLANLTEGNILANVLIQDETSTVGYYAKDIILPPNQSLRVINGGEKLILGISNVLYVKANTEDSLDVIASYIEIV